MKYFTHILFLISCLGLTEASAQNSTDRIVRVWASADVGLTWMFLPTFASSVFYSNSHSAWSIQYRHCREIFGELEVWDVGALYGIDFDPSSMNDTWIASIGIAVVGGRTSGRFLREGLFGDIHERVPFRTVSASISMGT